MLPVSCSVLLRSTAMKGGAEWGGGYGDVGFVVFLRFFR